MNPYMNVRFTHELYANQPARENSYIDVCFTIVSDRRILMKKRSKLLRRESEQSTARMKKLKELEDALLKSHLEEEKMEESAANESTKLNPKYFFNYVK